MRPLWQEVMYATDPSHHRDGSFTVGFTINGTTHEVQRRCLICDATFPQTDDGFAAMKQHGFDEHEQVMPYDYRELEGLRVTLHSVERVATVGFGDNERPDSSGRTQISLVAEAEDGTLYFLPDPDQYSWQDKARGDKCRPKSRGSNLLKLTQPEVASRSNG